VITFENCYKIRRHGETVSKFGSEELNSEPTTDASRLSSLDFAHVSEVLASAPSWKRQLWPNPSFYTDASFSPPLSHFR